jgi:hypothetical protein
LKKLLFFIIFCTLAVNAQFSTPGTGVQWTMDSLVTRSGGVVTGAFPNYTIAQACTVSVGDRLTINQGSIITFTLSTAGIVTLGSLQVLGAPNDSVYFKGATEDPLGAYDGLRFTDTGADTNSIIQYAVFTHAYYGARCLNANPKVLHSRFYKVRRPFQLSTASPIIKYCNISYSYEYGVTLTLGSSPIIEHNTFYNNNTQNTSPKNQISIGTQNANSPTIRYNKIHGGAYNKTGGISISALFAGSSSTSEIAFNEIYDNSYGISLAGGDITCYVHDNLIYNNNINPDPQVSGSGINLNGTANNRPTIARNTIHGNYWGVTVQNGTTIQAGPTGSFGNLTNADTTDDGFNKIYGNLQGTTVYDFFNNCSNDLYAQNNDWGVYDSLAIEGHITHKVDDPLRGSVFFIPFIDSSLVPVELVSLQASTINGKVIIDWATATERNNKGFYVERIAENENSWSIVGFVDGKGTSTFQNNYSFTDILEKKGIYAYRLRQIDFDGTASISKTIFIEFGNDVMSHQLNQNYPNPFNPETVIKYTVGGSEPTRVALRIYDALGAQVAELVDKIQDPGSYTVKFNTSNGEYNLSSGVYLYEITINSTTISKKLVINK